MSKLKISLIVLLSLIFLTGISVDCIGQSKTNSLIGKIYRDINEIKELKNFYGGKATLIENNDPKISDKYAITQITDTIERKHIIIFEELLYDALEPGKPKYLILDTLTVKSDSGNDLISFCECYQNSEFRPEIIALVSVEQDVEFFTKIKKAWYADFKTKRIIPLEDKSKIKCSNFEIGCDDEDDTEEN